MSEIICIGQAVVDCITAGLDKESLKKRSARAEMITLSVGGDAVNESSALSALGHDVKTVALVGEDIPSGIIRTVLNERGVDPSGLQAKEDIHTVVADIFANEDGTRRSINSKAISLGGHQIDPEVLDEDVKAVCLASIFRAPLTDPKSVYELAKAVKDNGAYLFADTKVPVYSDLTLDDFKDVLPLVDCIFPNETEASYFSRYELPKEIEEKDLEAMAQVFLDYGVKRVIVKAGDKGAYYTDGKQSFRIPAFPVEVVDSTGAGDNFAAGFISCFLEGKSIPECLRFASAAAALSLQSAGAFNKELTKQKIEEFLNSVQ